MKMCYIVHIQYTLTVLAEGCMKPVKEVLSFSDLGQTSCTDGKDQCQHYGH